VGEGGGWPEQWALLVPHHPHCEQHSPPLAHAPFPLLPPPQVPREGGVGVGGGGDGLVGWPEQWALLVPHHPHCEQHSPPLAHAPCPLLPPPQVPREGGVGVGGGGDGLVGWPEQWALLVPHHPHCEQHSPPLAQTPFPLIPPPQVAPEGGGTGVGLPPEEELILTSAQFQNCSGSPPES
jgi:hypothetical protein